MSEPCRLQFLGSGDTFASGGRLQTCFHLTAPGDGVSALIDCGATALVSLRRFGVDPNAIDTVIVSHLHGDHFGGLPFFLLDAQLVSRRTAPLTLVGPPGFTERLTQAREVLFPGSSRVAPKYPLSVRDLEVGASYQLGGLSVRLIEVRHPSGAPACAVRIEVAGRVFAYSGDTEWVESLVEAARDADLFVAEGYVVEKPVPYHLVWRTLEAQLPRLGVRRLILTHPHRDLLARRDEVDAELAEDGQIVAF